MSTRKLRRAGRRTRVMVSAVAGVALVAGGLVFATSASAATSSTPPTLTVTAPAKISNDQQVQPLTVKIDNPSSGTQLTTKLHFDLGMAVPSGVTCSKITLVAADATSPKLTMSGTAPSCGADVALPAAINAGQSVTYSYKLSIDAATVTGTIATAASIVQPAVVLLGITISPAQTIAKSTGVSTNLINPVAPSFNAAPPAAPLHKDYSYQLVADPGFAKNPTTYSVFKTQQGATSFAQLTSRQMTEPDGSTHTVFDLDPGFVFDTNTGQITASGSQLSTPNGIPTFTYVVVANNGTGGTTTPSGQLVAHDVASPFFTLPVVFSDVTVSSLFGKAIYTLADSGLINGNTDGTFRPTKPVLRQEFAHFLAEYLTKGTGKDTDGSSVVGPCDPTATQLFVDVPNGELFCREIQFLARKGIINGYTNGTFRPTSSISRQEMSAMLYRLRAVDLNLNPTTLGIPKCTSAPFSDVSTSNLFCGYISWLVKYKITQGYGDGTFRPKNGVARQEAAQFIYNFGVLEARYSA